MKIFKKTFIFLLVLFLVHQFFNQNTFALNSEIRNYINYYNFADAYKQLNLNLYDEDGKLNPISLRQMLEIENMVTDTSTMILHAIELVEYSQKNKDYYNQMIGYYYLGTVYYELYDDNKAIENFENMLEIAQERNYPLGKGLYYMFMGYIYNSYTEKEKALENFNKAQPFFEEMKLDEYWIFPDFKYNNQYMIDLITIMSDSTIDKKVELVKLGNTHADKNWSLKINSYSRAGYELNKLGAFREGLEFLTKTKELINQAEFGDMFNKFDGYLDFDLAYSYHSLGEYEQASSLLLKNAYKGNTKLEVERGEFINSKLREIESKELKKQAETKNRIILAIVSLLLFLLILVIVVIRQYKITEKLNKEIYEKSIRDTMTGLYNRSEIINIYQNNIEKNISLAIIDIDNFKNINDTYGHAMGDVVIKEIANTISSVIGPMGETGRYGGEEFLVILYNTPDSNTKEVFELIRKSIEEKKWTFKETPITISIGLLLEAKNTNFNSGFRAADELLYLAKRKGKNVICHI